VSRIRDASAEEIVPLADLGAMTAEVRHELDAVWDDIVSRSVFIGGDPVALFEEQWASYCGTRHAVGVANGTDAIELTLRALGIGPGDEVIVPANTFVATVEAVVLAGAIPRFVDVDEETLLVTPEIVRAVISERTAAVIAVELYGNVPRIDELAILAEASHIALIEDAAQAHGSAWEDKPAGSFGVAGCFSFYPGKNLGAFGDAGCVVTDDAALAAAIRSLANHGRPPDSAHVHSVVARNSRLDALQAGVLAVKMARLDAWNAARREAVETYRRWLRADRIRMLAVEPAATSVYHQHVVRVEGRDVAREALFQRGIQTGIHYPIPCHLQAPYQTFATGPLPVVERAAGEILSLPLYPHITESQVLRVCECLNQHVAESDHP
jgi:dTDP-4-amino-4,6-dideoxygalactose transaminase